MKLFPPPELQTGESILDSWPANRTQSRNRAVGGCLFLTTQRLAFVPNLMDAAFAGRDASMPLHRIMSVGLQPREFSFRHLFDGGLRTRLRVETDSGAHELFVVQEPAELQRKISDVVASIPKDRTA